MGKLGDLYGRKGFFQAAIRVVPVRLGAHGRERVHGQAIAFRAIQSLGASGLIVGGTALIGDLLPPRERGRYEALFAQLTGRLILAGVGVLAVTLVFHLYSAALHRDNHSLAHKRVLLATEQRLAGRRDQCHIAQTTLDAAVELVATSIPGRTVHTAVAVGTNDRLQVTAATDAVNPALGRLLWLDGGGLQPAEPGHGRARKELSLLDRGSRTARRLPISTGGRVLGLLLLDAGEPVDPELDDALRWLCGSAGLALENAALTAELTSLALHDPLTRLANRVLLSEQTRTALARSARTGAMVAVLGLDLDGFKRINDRYGHRAGDETLKVVAARVRDQLRDGDVPARLGGDEFAVLLPDLHSPRDATAVARRIIGALDERLDIGEHQVTVGISIGIALWAPPRDDARPGRGQASQPDLDDLLHDADRAMYLAKSTGAGCAFPPGAALPLPMRRQG